MKKSLFLIALASMAVVGCSKDEITEINPDNAIKFTATAAKATRASEIVTTTNIMNFNIWAYTTDATPATFMNKVIVSREDEDSDWTYSPLRFLPNDTYLMFYSAYPTTDITTEFTAITQKIKDFTVNTNVDEQIDLLYATNVGEVDAGNTTPSGLSKQSDAVAINFRHALSQIVFQAKITSNAKSNIEVDIEENGVTVHNIKTTGTLTYPELTTNPHLDEDAYDKDNNDDTDKGETENDAVYGETYGEWELENDTNNFTAGIVNKIINKNTTGQPVALTRKEAAAVADDPATEGVDESTSAVKSGALLLLPQTITPWDPTTTTKPTESKDAYFAISCKIKDLEADGDRGYYLYGNANEYKTVYIPVPEPKNKKWEQGKKYIYTFVFDDGAGYDENGNEVLVPIKVEVTVDEFQSANEIPVTM